MTPLGWILMGVVYTALAIAAVLIVRAGRSGEPRP
jgi:hypothetical protein